MSENKPRVRLCLVAGKIAGRDRQRLKDYFTEQGWILRDQDWVREGVAGLAKHGYENDIATITTKILRQGKVD